MGKRVSKIVLSAVSGLALCQASGAWANEAAQAGSDGADDANAIVVTARRVEERLQDVPISITVFSQEQIAQRNLVNVQDLALYTPSLSVSRLFGSENASLSLRGFV